jgi:hypothetical protein
MNFYKNISRLRLPVVAFLLMLSAAGCAGLSVGGGYSAGQSLEARFEARLDNLVAEVLREQKGTKWELAPVAVVPGAFRSGRACSRLAEKIMERLRLGLREQHEIHDLSRRNWLEFQEGRPLSFPSRPKAEENYLRHLLIYEVRLQPEEGQERIGVSVFGSDARGRSLPGIVVRTELDFGPQSPAHRFYEARAAVNPIPEGLEGRPYASIDRMAFSLAGELLDAYRRGFAAGDGRAAADREIQVLLYTKPQSAGIPAGLVERVGNSLQQAIVGNRGYTCAVSRGDTGPAFEQAAFYRRNRRLFDVEKSFFKAGTVLLLAEHALHPDGDKIGLSLKGLWLAGPLEDRRGNLVESNLAGTYVSGFTAKAYYSIRGAGSRQPASAATGKTDLQKSACRISAGVGAFDAAGTLGVCFYDFSAVLERRIYEVLSKAPTVENLRRADALCRGSSACAGYELEFGCPLQAVGDWLERNLRTSEVVPFRTVFAGPRRLDVFFDGGFD